MSSENLLQLQNKWCHWSKIDWSDKQFQQFHIDTRDFHVLCNTDVSRKLPAIEPLLKYRNDFFYSADEIQKIIHRLFEESGGEGGWRALHIQGCNHDGKHNYWLKYIRIFQTDHGFIVCDQYFYALRKDKLSGPVIKNLL